MLASISHGDTLNCIFCHKDFILDKVNFDFVKEYITCPHCKKTADIQSYHIGNATKEAFKAHIDALIKSKVRKECCDGCLYDAHENGRGYFCLLNGEIRHGAERMNWVNPCSIEAYFVLDKYHEKCETRIDKEKYLVTCREKEREKE